MRPRRRSQPCPVAAAPTSAYLACVSYIRSPPSLAQRPTQRRELSFLGLACPRGLERRLVVGVDNPRHKFMPNDIFGGIDDMANSLDVPQQPRCFGEA